MDWMRATPFFQTIIFLCNHTLCSNVQIQLRGCGRCQMCSVLCSRCGGGGAGTCVRAALPKTLPVYSCGPSSARHGSRCVPVPGPVLPSPACSDHTHTTLCTCREEQSRGDLASGHKQIILVKQFCIYTYFKVISTQLSLDKTWYISARLNTTQYHTKL